MNTKNKRTEVRVTDREKEKLESYAEHRGLSLSEYLCKRGLGYEPGPLLDERFYAMYSKLCKISNADIAKNFDRFSPLAQMAQPKEKIHRR